MIDFIKYLLLGALVGFSVTTIALRNEAKEIRLIGMCGGKLLGAMEEDNFPEGCKWIEKVNYYDHP